jgi:hypothetical protein
MNTLMWFLSRCSRCIHINFVRSAAAPASFLSVIALRRLFPYRWYLIITTVQLLLHSRQSLLATCYTII